MIFVNAYFFAEKHDERLLTWHSSYLGRGALEKSGGSLCVYVRSQKVQLVMRCGNRSAAWRNGSEKRGIFVLLRRRGPNRNRKRARERTVALKTVEFGYMYTGRQNAALWKSEFIQLARRWLFRIRSASHLLKLGHIALCLINESSQLSVSNFQTKKNIFLNRIILKNLILYCKIKIDNSNLSLQWKF